LSENEASCICGSTRTFEFQIMPSVLHILKVEEYAQISSSDISAEPSKLAERGMSWDILAIYSCPLSCNESTEEVILVQETGQ